jgi:ribosomal protein L16 Arg81 hydroxylase
MPTVLESLLAPISPIEFRERYYGKQPLLVRGHAKKFADLFDWDDLNRVLNTSSYPNPHVEISSPHQRQQPTSSQSVIEQCRAGASLVFRQLELFDPKVGELMRALEAEIGAPMFVALILSPPSQGAFERHWDRYDGFILHIDGHKAWTVYDEPFDKPIFYFAENQEDPPGHPILECELAPGDLLYVPRGHWHQAVAQRGLSLHLTFAVKARTGIDFLTWLVDRLRSDVRFRHELPLSFADEPADLHATRLREHVTRLGEILDSRLQDDTTIQSYLEHCAISDDDVRRFNFPAQLLEAPATQLDV